MVQKSFHMPQRILDIKLSDSGPTRRRRDEWWWLLWQRWVDDKRYWKFFTWRMGRHFRFPKYCSNNFPVLWSYVSDKLLAIGSNTGERVLSKITAMYDDSDDTWQRVQDYPFAVLVSKISFLVNITKVKDLFKERIDRFSLVAVNGSFFLFGGYELEGVHYKNFFRTQPKKYLDQIVKMDASDVLWKLVGKLMSRVIKILTWNCSTKIITLKKSS